MISVESILESAPSSYKNNRSREHFTEPERLCMNPALPSCEACAISLPSLQPWCKAEEKAAISAYRIANSKSRSVAACV
jgi:hypothetical protein